MGEVGESTFGSTGSALIDFRGSMNGEVVVCGGRESILNGGEPYLDLAVSSHYVDEFGIEGVEQSVIRFELQAGLEVIAAAMATLSEQYPVELAQAVQHTHDSREVYKEPPPLPDRDWRVPDEDGEADDVG